jgi:hypothetical protein
LYDLLGYVAKHHPKRYKDVLLGLISIGDEAAEYHGGVASLTLDSFKTPKRVKALRQKALDKVNAIRKTSQPEDVKRDKIVSTLRNYNKKLEDLTYGEKEGTSLWAQISSGAKGKKLNLLKILAGNLETVGPYGESLDIPITRGWAEGMTPADYWLSGYPARLGYFGTKFATPVAGDISNQLMLATQRLRVTEKDCGTNNGLMVDPRDADYEGAVLARGYDAARAGSVLTPERMKRLAKSEDRIFVRSPSTCQTEHGVCQKCSGKIPDEYPEMGDFVGITAAQAIAEPLSQQNISAKHQGKRVVGGIDTIKALVTASGSYAGFVPVAESHGLVEDMRENAAGGTNITISGKTYSLPPEVKPKLRQGQTVNSGDALGEGIPNPQELTRVKGIGEARRRFSNILSDVLNESGIRHNRRNVDFLSRALINHVRVKEPFGNFFPGDLVEYPAIERQWEPRESAEKKSPGMAKNMYLESPIAHYTIGTKITPDVVKTLKKRGYGKVLVNKQPPPFQSEMRRAMESMAHSNDPFERLAGYWSKRHFLKSLHGASAKSDPTIPNSIVSQIILEGEIRPLNKRK